MVGTIGVIILFLVCVIGLLWYEFGSQNALNMTRYAPILPRLKKGITP